MSVLSHLESIVGRMVEQQERIAASYAKSLQRIAEQNERLVVQNERFIASHVENIAVRNEQILKDMAKVLSESCDLTLKLSIGSLIYPPKLDPLPIEFSELVLRQVKHRGIAIPQLKFSDAKVQPLNHAVFAERLHLTLPALPDVWNAAWSAAWEEALAGGAHISIGSGVPATEISFLDLLRANLRQGLDERELYAQPILSALEVSLSSCTRFFDDSTITFEEIAGRLLRRIRRWIVRLIDKGGSLTRATFPSVSLASR